jgi:hypothetical protein
LTTRFIVELLHPLERINATLTLEAPLEVFAPRDASIAVTVIFPK